ncbi:dioxygenase [Microbacterium sp. KSW4-17]|uniref:Dioxygenase n=1 Tax=Microbacterium galbum TaxID=3075994 RepID=A0ABU3TB86_9MICO|nr:dioxygenase [Microbacterium sp. KSW4-17]MDU0368594.1 dioxygenase [Microbacterium sp. KSW4-17]
MATRGKDRQTREQRERARAYQVRVALHERQRRRRTRDDVLGVVIGLVVIAGAVGAQTAYFVAGPGAPAPAQSPSAPAIESPASPTTAPTTAP